MVLRHLRYFATVADRGSVSQAALYLGVAQPALSRQLRDLEEAIGTPLLRRDRRGVELTPAGRGLRRDIQIVFDRLEETVRRIHLAGQGRLGTIRLGLSRPAIGADLVLIIFAKLREQYPEVALVVTELGEVDQLDPLSTNNLDAAVGLGVPTDGACSHLVLFNERINCAMLAQSHPLAAFASLTPSQLRGEDLRLDTSLLLSARLLAPALERLGLSWREAHTLETAYGHVLAGNGWTPVPQSFRNSPPIDTTIVPLQGLDVEVPMTLRWRKDNDLPAVRNFAAIAAGAANGATRPNGSIKVPGAKICAVAEQKTTPFGADTRPAIELRQLRAALTTMQEGSISGAARRLHLTQPAVARQIHSLERELGTPLVHRGASGLVPTAAGEVFRAEARGVLTTVDDAVDRAKLLARGIVGRCLIGSPPAELTDGLLARTLRQLKVRHPELSVTIRLRAPVAGLAAHEIDVALHRVHGGVANEPNLCTVVLREDALDCALIASDHPRASREWLTPIELADMPLLSGSRASNPAFYDAVTRAIVPVGLARSQPGEYNSARIIFSMVAKGVGWTLVSRSIRGHTPAGTVVIPIEGVSIFWGLALSWRREELSPTVRIVIDSFRGVTGT